MEKPKKELRMYSLVLYSLSGIQAGIQAGHSWVEYESKNVDTPVYREWADKHKTVMVMNGGGSPRLREYEDSLISMGVNYSTFEESDLYGKTTAISFIVDVCSFNKTALTGLTLKEMCLKNFIKGLTFHGGR
jgi:hypothetical protein